MGPQSIAASHSFILITLKLLICSLLQSDCLDLNDPIQENGSGICLPPLSFRSHPEGDSPTWMCFPRASDSAHPRQAPPDPR